VTAINSLLVQQQSPDEEMILELAGAIDSARRQLQKIPAENRNLSGIDRESALHALQQIRGMLRSGESIPAALAKKAGAGLELLHSRTEALEFLDLIDAFGYDKALNLLDSLPPGHGNSAGDADE
jgi:hypothetical protein